MTMTMDSQQRHHLGSMGFDHMPYSVGPPQFSNPWVPTSSTHTPSSLYPTSLATSSLAYDTLSKPQSGRTTAMSMPYTSIPTSAPAMGTTYSGLPYSQSELLSSSQDLLNGSRTTYDQNYVSAPSQSTSTYATHPGTYAPMSSYGQSLAQQQQQQSTTRRLSQRFVVLRRLNHTVTNLLTLVIFPSLRRNRPLARLSMVPGEWLQ